MFKVGDRLEFIDEVYGLSRGIKVGWKGVVINVNKDVTNTSLIEVKFDNGDTFECYAKRWKKVEKVGFAKWIHEKGL